MHFSLSLPVLLSADDVKHIAGRGTSHPAMTSSISTQRHVGQTCGRISMENPATFFFGTSSINISSIHVYSIDATFLSLDIFGVSTAFPKKKWNKETSSPEIRLRIQGNRLRDRQW